MRFGSQLVLSRYSTSMVVLVLKHGSRSIEGVYLKSPEINQSSMFILVIPKTKKCYFSMSEKLRRNKPVYRMEPK